MVTNACRIFWDSVGSQEHVFLIFHPFRLWTISTFYILFNTNIRSILGCEFTQCFYTLEYYRREFFGMFLVFSSCISNKAIDIDQVEYCKHTSTSQTCRSLRIGMENKIDRYIAQLVFVKFGKIRGYWGSSEFKFEQ